MFSKKRLIPGIVMEPSEDADEGEKARLMARSNSGVSNNGGGGDLAPIAVGINDLPKLASEIFETGDSQSGASSPR